ncbi:MAG: PIG-L family deacetylase [Oscillospiraceae bacterium]|nr:PIG-L family deacetylase [Oscillospiraceae bacterium]
MNNIKQLLIPVLLLLLLTALSACGEKPPVEETSPPVSISSPSASLEAAPAPSAVPEIIPEKEETSLKPEPEPETDPVPEEEELSAESPEPDYPAEDLTAALSCTVGGGSRWAFGDRDWETYNYISSYEEILFHCDTPVKSLYFIWDCTPGEYTLEYEGGSVLCGEKGFWHEYISLPEEITDFRLCLSGTEYIRLCDVYAYSEGAVPDYVQKWKEPWEEADLLLISTHCDDEHIFFGGTLPYYGRERGYRVQVAYQIGHITNALRTHEALNGLWTVGIDHYPVFSTLKDIPVEYLSGGRYAYGEEGFCEYQVEQLRRFKPSVVLAQDIKGEYGHGAHCLTGDNLCRSVYYAADESIFPESAEKYGTWDTPKTYLHLYPENRIFMDWKSIYLESFGGLSAEAVAIKGLDCHVSEQFGDMYNYYNRYWDSRIFGLYRSLVGEDVNKNDFFENIPEESLKK